MSTTDLTLAQRVDELMHAQHAMRTNLRAVTANYQAVVNELMLCRRTMTEQEQIVDNLWQCMSQKQPLHVLAAPHRPSLEAPPHRPSLEAPPHRPSLEAPPHRPSLEAPRTLKRGADEPAPPLPQTYDGYHHASIRAHPFEAEALAAGSHLRPSHVWLTRT